MVTWKIQMFFDGENGQVVPGPTFTVCANSEAWAMQHAKSRVYEYAVTQRPFMGYSWTMEKINDDSKDT